MKQHEREFFISRIRSGIYQVKRDGFKLKVMMPTIEDECELNQVYLETYEEALEDGILTQDEMTEVLKKRGVWSDEDESKLTGVPKDIERFKVEAFRARNDQIKLERVRFILRSAEVQLANLVSRKNTHQENTCEGIAAIHKSVEFIRRCTHLGKEVYEFENDNEMSKVLNQYYGMLLSEKIIRDIARNEPWRSMWMMNDSKAFDLFNKNGRELSVDQRNLLVWSNMYSNIYESMDCPADDVIDDDDMLDGWLILQKEKRNKDKLQGEMDKITDNDKIKNSGEIFLMAKTKKDADRIDSMNDTHGKTVKQQRLRRAKQVGQVSVGEFADEKMEMNRLSNEGFKGKFN